MFSKFEKMGCFDLFNSIEIRIIIVLENKFPVVNRYKSRNRDGSA